MIKKLQLTFILLSMGALLIVLTLIIAGINLINYQGMLQDADRVLDLLSENNGSFPMPSTLPDREGDKNRNEKGKDREAPPNERTDSMMVYGLPPDMSPELPFESRYFSVFLNSNSHAVIQAETSRIISVDTKEAIDYAQMAAEATNPRGFAGNFRYIRYEEGDGLRIIFLDCGRKLDSFQDFLRTSISISLAGYLLVFLLVVFFSNRIIRPVSESYEKQKQFITDAGHEIKTPLAIIHADTDVLEIEIGENEWLEDIRRQANRLTLLTNDLIYLARMEEGGEQALITSFSLSQATEDEAVSFHALAQTQEKDFYCQIQPQLFIRGDEKAIRRLICILLDNALKYSPAGGRVELNLEKQNKLLQLRVFNTTIDSIPAEKLPLLFERFYRTDTSRHSQTGGYGIGLSIAKAIVEAHHGKIEAETTDGFSLCLSVSLPFELFPA